MKSKNNKMSVIFVYVSRVINSILSFLITYLATKKINNTVLFGEYSYILTIINYITLFIGFGFNDAIMNILVNLKNLRKISEICAIGYVLSIIFGTIFSTSLFIISLFNKNFKVSFLIIIFAQSIILNNLLNQIAIASKKITVMVINKFLINITILLFYFFVNTTYNNYLIIYFTSYFVYTNIIFFIFNKPKFNKLKLNFYVTLKKVKVYGFNVYLGRMASMGTYDLDKIMIKMFAPISYVGFYNLGLSCISPITMFSNSLMSVLFKDISKQKRLSNKILFINIVWLIVLSICFMTIGRYLFLIIFGEKYAYVAQNFTLFGILAFFSGLFVPFNNFLAVKGCGKYLRNTAFILTVSNVIFNCLLIPRYKMVGAIYATIISLIVDNIAHYYYYKKAIGELEEKEILAS